MTPRQRAPLTIHPNPTIGTGQWSSVAFGNGRRSARMMATFLCEIVAWRTLRTGRFEVACGPYRRVVSNSEGIGRLRDRRKAVSCVSSFGFIELP